MSKADIWRLDEAADAFRSGSPEDVRYGLAMLKLLEKPNAYSLEASRVAWGGFLPEATACCELAKS